MFFDLSWKTLTMGTNEPEFSSLLLNALIKTKMGRSMKMHVHTILEICEDCKDASTKNSESDRSRANLPVFALF